MGSIDDRRRFSWLCAALLGCADGGDVSLQLDGILDGDGDDIAVSTRFSARHVDVSPADFDVGRAQHSATWGPGAAGALGDVDITLSLGFELAFGPYEGRLALADAGEAESSNYRMLGDADGEITEIAFTGRAQRPVRVRGTVDGGLTGLDQFDDRISVSEGRFSYRPRCGEGDNTSRWLWYCGAQAPDRVAEYRVDGPLFVDSCAEEIKALYLGTGEGQTFRLNGIAAGGVTTPCLTTGDGEKLCGANRAATVDGCAWETVGLAAPAGDGIRWFIAGKAAGRCESPTARCTTLVTATPR